MPSARNWSLMGGYTPASQPVTLWPASRASAATPPMNVPQMPRMWRCMHRLSAALPPSVVQTLSREQLAQLQFPELAGRRARDRVDELVALGQLPFREAVLQEMRGKLAGLGVLPRLEDDARERSFAPFLVRDRDDGRFGDGRVRHQRVFEVDGTDPLAARLDQVLRSVGDAQEPEFVDRRDVARAQPAVFSEFVGGDWHLVIAARDERAAH